VVADPRRRRRRRRRTRWMRRRQGLTLVPFLLNCLLFSPWNHPK